MTFAPAFQRPFAATFDRRAAGITWILRDDFTTNLAVGSVNGTAAEPGPGTRTTTDPSNKISISGGKLVFSNPNAWDSFFAITPTQARAAGLLCVWNFHPEPNEMAMVFGNDAWADGVLSNSSNDIRVWAPEIRVGKFAPNEVNYLTFAIRSTGFFVIVKNSVYSNQWCLRWINSTQTTSPLKPFVTNATVPTLYIYHVGVPTNLWLPTPLASDGFGSAFGTSDGLGHAEGIAGGVGAGGSGVTWSNGNRVLDTFGVDGALNGRVQGSVTWTAGNWTTASAPRFLRPCLASSYVQPNATRNH